jgi:hypothetical protein
LSQEEKRIYVIVAETVQTTTGSFRDFRSVKQPIGRIGAQIGHVVGKMRASRAHRLKESYTPITTIVLAARDSAELRNMGTVLSLGSIRCYLFFDSNEEYGRTAAGDINEVLTAICTDPIHPDLRLGLIDHLPLWSGK